MLEAGVQRLKMKYPLHQVVHSCGSALITKVLKGDFAFEAACAVLIKILEVVLLHPSAPREK